MFRQNSPFIEITFATTICSEGDFLVYEGFYTPSFIRAIQKFNGFF